MYYVKRQKETKKCEETGRRYKETGKRCEDTVRRCKKTKKCIETGSRNKEAYIEEMWTKENMERMALKKELQKSKNADRENKEIQVNDQRCSCL